MRGLQNGDFGGFQEPRFVLDVMFVTPQPIGAYFENHDFVERVSSQRVVASL